jgi:hypothetical protein
LRVGGAAVEDFGIDYRGGDVLVAEQLLDGADVAAVLEQVGGEGVAGGAAGGALRDGGPDRCAADGRLEGRRWRRLWPV